MSVEDKIKELLEASMHEATAPGKTGAKAEKMAKAPEDAEDLGPAVTEPEAKSGPDGSKKVKKAADPKASGKVAKEETEEDEDLEVVAEEEASEDEIVEAKKTVAKEEEDDEEEASDDEDEDDDDEEEEKSESKKTVKEAKKVSEEDDEDEDDDGEMEKMKEKLHAMVDKMDEMGLMKKAETYIKSSYHAKKANEEVDMSDDVSALTEGGEFDDEFKAKAKTIFEAAVNSKVSDKIVELEEHYDAQIEEETSKIAEDLTDKVDTYLSYVVEQWTKDNELAVERGLKSEITEDFIVSLKKVFEEHYIDVPEDKYDVMAEQQDKIAELEGKLNEQIEKNAETSKVINDAKKAIKVEESAKDLTDTQKEKFMSLVESVEFKDEDSFAQELETLKESYFPKIAKSIEEDEVAVEDETTVNIPSEMKDYVSAISRTLGK